jgi:hypothetical protein
VAAIIGAVDARMKRARVEGRIIPRSGFIGPVISRTEVKLITEACTEADGRLIKWDSYTIVANDFLSRIE